MNCTGQNTSPICLCLRLNTDGIRNIANACMEPAVRCIHISTVAVFGSAGEVDEMAPQNPETPYAVCKSAAEYIVRTDGPANSAIVRLSTLYGQEQPNGLLAYLINAAWGDRYLEFEHDGSLVRYFLHVRDAAEAIVRCAMCPKATGAFTIAGTQYRSVREVVAMVESAANVTYIVTHGNAKPRESIGRILRTRPQVPGIPKAAMTLERCVRSMIRLHISKDGKP